MKTSRMAPGSQTSLREANRARVLDVLQQHGPMTQVEIAGMSGLSAATVSNMVRDLDSAGAVLLSPSIRNGRRAVLVSPVPPDGLVAGIAFGDRDVRIAIGGEADRVLARQRLPLPADHLADEGLDRAVRILIDLIEQAGHKVSDLTAVGFGLPAPVDTETGKVGADNVLPGWRAVAVRGLLESQLGVPVVVDNTANLAAQGELVAGALQDVSNGCYIKASHGVGAGLVISGEIVRGSVGTAGEIGHMTIDENGPICRCGNRGCLETYVGAAAILDSLAASHGRLRLRDVIRRALDGDAGCQRVLADAGRHLGIAAAALVILINPQVIVLGGQLARVSDLVLKPMREAIDRRTLPSAAASVSLRTGALGDEADVVGALAVASALRAGVT